MLMVRLKERKEFRKACQGKVVYFSEDGSSIHYFVPARVNEMDVLYAFDSDTSLPFREHYDFEDEEGIHVQKLIEIEAMYCFDPNGMIPSEMLVFKPIEV
jgi:hypothetical protein